MKRIIFFCITTLVFGFSTPAFSADVAKIGVINFEKIMQESSAGKMNQNTLTKKGQQLKEKLKKEKDTLDGINKTLERESLVLSADKKREREREFRIRVNDFKKMQEDFAKEMKTLEIKLVNEMQKSVFEIANDIGKKEGFLLIIEKKNAGVIYAPAHVDITDKVIKKYNAKAAKSK